MPVIKLYELPAAITATSANIALTPDTHAELALLAGRTCIGDAVLLAECTVSNTPDWDFVVELAGASGTIEYDTISTVNASGTYLFSSPAATFRQASSTSARSIIPLGSPDWTLQLDLNRTTGDLDTFVLYLAFPDN